MKMKRSSELPGGWNRTGEADPAAYRRHEQRKRHKDSARRRWALLNAFADSGMAALKPADAVVWFALFRHAGPDGVATVARGLLVNMTGLAANTVKTSLARLCAAGWVDRMRRGGPSGGVAVYRVQHPGKVGQI